jgi:hypothetical protein
MPEMDLAFLLSDPDWTQTNDLLLRRQLLYSAELPDRFLKRKAKVIFLP